MTDTKSGTISQKERLAYGWVILTILSLAQVVMSIGAYAWGPLAPFLRNDFGITRAQVGALTSILYLASVIVATPSGVLVDKKGARIMLIICLLVMGISFICMAAVNSYFFLAVLAGCAGIGYGMINQVAVKGVMYWTTSRNRGAAMGVRQAGVTVGGAISATFLVVITGMYNWHLSVVIIGVLILIMAGLSVAFYREKPPELIEETVETTSASPASTAKIHPSKKATLGQVFRNPDLVVNMVAIPLLAGSQACLGSFLILFLMENIKLTEVTAGFSLTLAMIAGTVGRVGWGVISDRMFNGERIVTLLAICLLALLGSLGAIFLQPGSPKLLVFAIAILLGGTLLGFHGVLFALVGEACGAELAGSVVGILVTVAWTGIVLFPVAFGAIADSFGYRWSWTMVAVTAAISMAAYTYSYLRKARKITV